MRRLLALAAMGVAAASIALPSTPASACDPNRPPYCMTACGVVVQEYQAVRNYTGGRLPYWYSLDLGVCGS